MQQKKKKRLIYRIYTIYNIVRYQNLRLGFTDAWLYTWSILVYYERSNMFEIAHVSDVTESRKVQTVWLNT